MISRQLVLAHRGLWSNPREQNSFDALLKAIEMGFGVETDIRDLNREIVISHDPPTGDELQLDHFLEAASELENGTILALNVKSDGLMSLIDPNVFDILPKGSFFFDMSGPEALRYHRADLPTATRLSEFEGMPNLRAAGNKNCETIWLDSFHSDWWVDVVPDELVPDGCTAYIVSPELHGREPGLAWERLKERDWKRKTVGICTDLAVEFCHFMGGSVA